MCGDLGPYCSCLSRKKKKLVSETLKSSGYARATSTSASRSARESRPRQNARASRAAHDRSTLPWTDSVSKVTLQHHHLCYTYHTLQICKVHYKLKYPGSQNISCMVKINSSQIATERAASRGSISR